jgi:hypothetical protein
MGHVMQSAWHDTETTESIWHELPSLESKNDSEQRKALCCTGFQSAILFTVLNANPKSPVRSDSICLCYERTNFHSVLGFSQLFCRSNAITHRVLVCATPFFKNSRQFYVLYAHQKSLCSSDTQGLHGRSSKWQCLWSQNPIRTRQTLSYAPVFSEIHRFFTGHSIFCPLSDAHSSETIRALQPSLESKIIHVTPENGQAGDLWLGRGNDQGSWISKTLVTVWVEESE